MFQACQESKAALWISSHVYWRQHWSVCICVGVGVKVGVVIDFCVVALFLFGCWRKGPQISDSQAFLKKTDSTSLRVSLLNCISKNANSYETFLECFSMGKAMLLLIVWIETFVRNKFATLHWPSKGKMNKTTKNPRQTMACLHPDKPTHQLSVWTFLYEFSMICSNTTHRHRRSRRKRQRHRLNIIVKRLWWPTYKYMISVLGCLNGLL